MPTLLWLVGYPAGAARKLVRDGDDADAAAALRLQRRGLRFCAKLQRKVPTYTFTHLHIARLVWFGFRVLSMQLRIWIIWGVCWQTAALANMFSYHLRCAVPRSLGPRHTGSVCCCRGRRGWRNLPVSNARP